MIQIINLEFLNISRNILAQKEISCRHTCVNWNLLKRSFHKARAIATSKLTSQYNTTMFFELLSVNFKRMLNQKESMNFESHLNNICAFNFDKYIWQTHSVWHIVPRFWLQTKSSSWCQFPIERHAIIRVLHMSILNENFNYFVVLKMEFWWFFFNNIIQIGWNYIIQNLMVK